jgi:hypothetical protein
LICDEEIAVAVNPVGTDGGVVSAVLLTVTVTAALVALLLDVSFAIARKLCEPLPTLVVSQEIA